MNHYIQYLTVFAYLPRNVTLCLGYLFDRYITAKELCILVRVIRAQNYMHKII